MSVDEFIKRKMGQELTEHLVFQVRARLLRGTENYIKGMSEAATIEAAGLAGDILIEPVTTRAEVVVNIRSSAVESLKQGIKGPHQLRARIDEGIRVYGQQRIIDAFLSAGGAMTIAEFNADLTGLEVYTQGLFDRRVGGEDWGTLAADINENVTDKVAEWNFPLPAGYKDIWGE